MISQKNILLKQSQNFTFVIEAVNASLKRLNTDHVDSLLLHRPDPLMEPCEVGEAFNELKTSGKVLNFGVSNMNPMQMELLQSGIDYKISVNQVQLSICHTPMLNQPKKCVNLVI